MMTNIAVEELRRLQILNDYIAQSLEVAQRTAPLLQARGLWHSPYAQFAGARAPWATSYSPFGGSPFGGSPFGQSPMGVGGIGAGYHQGSVPGFDPLMGAGIGLTHTSAVPGIGGFDPVAALVAQSAAYQTPYTSAFVDPWRAELVRRAILGF